VILLIHPPVSKPCEPPAGLARLSSALAGAGLPHEVLDLGLEGLLRLLASPPTPAEGDGAVDTWTRRAAKNRLRHRDALRGWPLYRNLDRYTRAVRDLERVLETAGREKRVRVSLANYQHGELSPVRSSDLLRMAETPERDPFHPFVRERLAEVMERKRPSYVGLSLNFLSQALPAFSLLGILRREYPGTKVIVGGGLVTSWLNRPGWRNPFEGLVDHWVAGPGEEPLLRLLGLEGSSPGKAPAYDRFPMEAYLSPLPVLPYSASSGCYWSRCSFCPERSEGNPYVPTPPETVAADLKRLVAKTGPSLVHLLDNALTPALMKALAERPPGAAWYGFVRITPHLADPDFCLALRRSGCVLLQLGLESGDQAVLDGLEKGVDLGVASRALRALKAAGIATYVYLLFGTPRETPEAARKTLVFTAAHHESIDFLNLAVFNMPIEEAEPDAVARSPFYEGDLSLYTDFEHPRGWNRKEVRQFLDREFRRHPAIASIVRRDPPVFTSNHAPFFVMAQNGTLLQD
jgi:radical SAM superfamily enzyme YgiQ (UPF0313 family)